MQTEMILILTIFAAIIMTFSGGLTFLGNALAGMKDTDPYKISFVILLCGIVMFNMIFYLLHTIDRIVMNFYEDEDDQSLFAKMLKKGEFRHWYAVLFNTLLLSLLIINLILWYCHANSI